MELTRREFLKLCGAGSAGAAFLGMLDPESMLEASPIDIPLKKRWVTEKTTICCYCAVGCGAIVASENGKVVNIEGDPDHPINRGTLCPKGAAMYQIANNERRLNKVLYRAPGAYGWEEKSWDWAIDRIAKNIKKTRDDNWVEWQGSKLVNRTDAVAQLGGAALDNEECYLISKMARALGIVYLEHCARI
jgi:formate dehydrogenase alpha subunit (EC 1.2.1.2)